MGVQGCFCTACLPGAGNPLMVAQGKLVGVYSVSCWCVGVGVGVGVLSFPSYMFDVQEQFASFSVSLTPICICMCSREGRICVISWVAARTVLLQ